MDFSFYDIETDALDACRAGSKRTCCTTASSSADRVYMGDSTGSVAACSAHGAVALKKQLFDGAVHRMAFVSNAEAGDILFCVGVGECAGDAGLSDDLYLKVLVGSEMESCICALNLAGYTDTRHGHSKGGVSSFAVSNSGSLVAVGFQDGSVLLVALAISRPGPMCRTGTHVLLAASAEDLSRPVTGLHFVQGGNSGDNVARLFVVCDTSTSDTMAGRRSLSQSGGRPRTETDAATGGVVVFTLDKTSRLIEVRRESRSELHFPCEALDVQGAAANCSHVCVDTEQLVVARRKFVSVYSSTRKESEREYQEKGEPSGVHCISSSEILIYSPTHYAVCDLVDRTRYCTGDVPTGHEIAMVASTLSAVFLVTDTGSLVGLHRKDQKSRIGQYADRALFRPALELAAREGMGSGVSAAVARQYGDHLLSLGDEEGALSNYANAVGDMARPSLIIRKLMDACGVETLEKYLLELGTAKASNVYTDCLLVSIYAKGGKSDELQTFLDGRAAGDPGQVSSLAQLAARCLLESNFVAAAETLTRKYECHSMYVSVCMKRAKQETSGDQSTARAILAYMRELMGTVPGPELHDIILAHGVSLLELDALSFTELLVYLCCPSATVSEPLAVGAYVELFADYPNQCCSLLLVVYLSLEMATMQQGGMASNFFGISAFPVPLLQGMLAQMHTKASVAAGVASGTGNGERVPVSSLEKSPQEYLPALSQWWRDSAVPVAAAHDAGVLMDVVSYAQSLLRNRTRGGNSFGGATNHAAAASDARSGEQESSVGPNFISTTADTSAAQLTSYMRNMEETLRAREKEYESSHAWLRQAGVSAGEKGSSSSSTCNSSNKASDAENRQWWKIREDQVKRSADHDLFRRELEAGGDDDDAFAPLARMFGKVLILSKDKDGAGGK